MTAGGRGRGPPGQAEAFRKAVGVHGKKFSEMAARAAVPDKPVGALIAFYYRRSPPLRLPRPIAPPSRRAAARHGSATSGRDRSGCACAPRS